MKKIPHKGSGRVDAAGLPEPARSALLRASRLVRLHRAERAARAALLTAGFVAAASALATLVEPGIDARSRTAFFLSGLIPLFAAAVAALRKVPIRDAALALDRRAGLPDEALAAVECAGDSPWQQAARERAGRRLAEAGRGGASRLAGRLALRIALPVAVAAAIAIGISPTIPTAPDGTADPLDPEIAGTIASQIRELAPAPADTSDPPGEPSRAGTTPDRRAVFVEIARAEERLRAAMPEVADASELASALEGIAGLVSPALAKGAWNDAAANAARLAADQPAPPPPATRAHLEALAAKLEAAGHKTLAQALRALASAASNADFSEALEKLARALAEQQRAQDALDASRQALLRLAAAREAAGERDPEAARAMLSAGDDPGKPGGKGAGGGSEDSDSDPVARQDPAALLGIAGTRASEGPVEVEVYASRDAVAGSPSRAPDPKARPDEETLSSTAVSPEELPLAHRHIIRRYFDTIRSQ